MNLPINLIAKTVTAAMNDHSASVFESDHVIWRRTVPGYANPNARITIGVSNDAAKNLQ